MPAFTASRSRAKLRARSAGPLAAASAERLAGRNTSPTRLSTTIIAEIASRPWRWPSARKASPIASRLPFMIRIGSEAVAQPAAEPGGDHRPEAVERQGLPGLRGGEAALLDQEEQQEGHHHGAGAVDQRGDRQQPDGPAQAREGVAVGGGEGADHGGRGSGSGIVADLWPPIPDDPPPCLQLRARPGRRLRPLLDDRRPPPGLELRPGARRGRGPAAEEAAGDPGAAPLRLPLGQRPHPPLRPRGDGRSRGAPRRVERHLSTPTSSPRPAPARGCSPRSPATPAWW